MSGLPSCPEPAGKGAAEILGEEAATANADSTMGLSFMLSYYFDEALMVCDEGDLGEL